MYIYIYLIVIILLCSQTPLFDHRKKAGDSHLILVTKPFSDKTMRVVRYIKNTCILYMLLANIHIKMRIYIKKTISIQLIISFHEFVKDSTPLLWFCFRIN